MAQPDDPQGARRRLPDTVSGLDESQIAAQDLQALRDAVHLRPLLPEAQMQLKDLTDWQPRLPAGAVKTVQLGFSEPPLFTLHIVPLPEKAVLHRLALQAPAVRINRNLAPVLARSIRRRRMRVDDLPQEKQRALFEALFVKYGESARDMDITAVFAHIPPEAAEFITVEPGLTWAAFKLPPGKTAGAMRVGFYLVVLRTPSGETRKVLFRL